MEHQDDATPAAGLDVRRGINVLVVSFDALRADHLGLYGYPRPVSPRMDEIAGESMVFEDVWATSSSTPSSFAGAFTGRLPTEVFRGWELVETPTLAEHFAANGYATAFVGSNPQLAAGRGFDRGFETYDLLDDPGANDEEAIGGLALDLDILGRAQDLLGSSRRPFFLWVHFFSPHAPYEHRPAASHLYDEAYSGPFAETSGKFFDVAGAADLDRLVDLYDGEVLFADELFGELTAELAGRGLERDTLVVLTADHGEEFGEHGGLQHQGVHREVLRIPLLLRHPDWPPGGRRSSAPASHLDLAPTLAAAAGLPPFPSAAGVSLLAPVDPERLRVGVAMTHHRDHYVAAARGAEKLIVSCSEKTAELFDLSRDPGELRDLGEERPRRLRALFSDLRDALKGEPCRVVAQANRGVDPTETLTTAQVAQLRALGYLGAGERGESEGGPPAGRVWAVPDPIPDCRGTGLGQTTVQWNVVSPSGQVEIRVLPDNRVFTTGGQSGEGRTGIWVRDDMGFAAVDPESGSVLAVTRVALTREGCP